MMQLVQPKGTAAQVEIAKERLQIRANRLNQSVVNGNRHIVWKQCNLEGRRIMSCSRVEDISLDGVSKGRGKCVLMVAKFCIELMESSFAQLMIALDQK